VDGYDEIQPREDRRHPERKIRGKVVTAAADFAEYGV